MVNKYCIYLLLFYITITPSYGQHQPENTIVLNPDEGLGIRSIDISKNGNYFATGSHIPILWNSNTGEKIREYDGHNEIISNNDSPVIDSISISFDNKYIISGDRFINIVVHDIYTGEVISRMKSTNNITSGGIFNNITISTDNRFIISATESGEIEIWNLMNGSLIKKLRNRGHLSSFVLLPDDKHILIAIGAIILIDIDTDNNIHQFPGSRPFVSDDGKTLQVSEGNQFDGYEIVYYDLQTYEKIRDIPLGINSFPRAVDMSPDAKNFLMGSRIQQNGSTNIINRVLFDSITPGSIRSYTARANADSNSFESEDQIIKYFPNGRKFLTVNGNSVHIWDISDVVTRVRDAGFHNN